MDFTSSMNAAVAHHRNGRFAEAAAGYRAVLAAFPEQPDALHLLGLATHRLGDTSAAIALVERALAVAPEHPGYHASHGNLLLERGRFEEAAATFRAGLAAAPADAESRNGLALALRELRRFDEAETLLRAVVAEQPRFVPALDNLAALLLERRKFEEAEALARQALALAPDDPFALNNLGGALYQQRKAEEAEPLLRRALQLKPDHVEAKFNLALALGAQGRKELADPLLRECVKARPSNVAYLIALSDTVRELSLADEALALARRAMKLDPDSVDVKVSYSAALRERNEHAAAAEIIVDILKTNPTAAFWSMLASLQWEIGDLDAARTSVTESLALDPDNISARVVLANLARTKSADDENLLALARLVDAPQTLAAERVNVDFTLGKAYDDLGEHRKAFFHYERGNRGRRAELGAYNRPAESQTQSDTAAVYTPEAIARLSVHGSPSEVPVFVVGQPRSGTSLAEQIIASHPQAFGAGELLKMREIVARIGSRSVDRGGPEYPAAVLGLAPAEIREFADMYLDKLTSAAGGPMARIVDKMPGNFKHIGLISVLFPHAHIVHCTRDPMDNCLSMYFQNFGRGNSHSYDLEDLAYYYGNYRRAMAHWHQVLPGRIFDLPYEQVVADPEHWSRALIAHIGLPWDPRCLDFHETERVVRTASAWQVKQPIYKRSVARWRRYEQELEPLRKALLAQGVAVES